MSRHKKGLTKRACYVYLQEAIAYYPLTLFVSGVLGSAVAKKLNQVIGSRVSSSDLCGTS